MSSWGNYSGAMGYSHVSGDTNWGPTVTPNPVVALTPCDPLNIDNIFAGVESIKTSNNNSELISFCAGPGANCMNNGTKNFFSSATDAVVIGVTGETRDYSFYNFEADGDSTVTIRGTVRFFVENNFILKSNAQLLFDPDASLVVYHEGEVSGDANSLFWLDSNTFANYLGITANFQMYSKAYDEEESPGNWVVGKEKITIDSNTGFYGVIYAPRAHIVINSNTNIHGSIRGSYVTLDSNVGFMYDEDLDNLWIGVPIDYELVYWAEFYPE